MAANHSHTRVTARVVQARMALNNRLNETVLNKQLLIFQHSAMQDFSYFRIIKDESNCSANIIKTYNFHIIIHTNLS